MGIAGLCGVYHRPAKGPSVTGLGLPVPTPPGVIARLDPKSGLPDFGTLNGRNRKRPISIGNPVSTAGGYWIARSSRAMTAQRQVSTAAGQPNRKMLYFSLRAVLLARRTAALVRHPAQRQPPFLMK